MNYIKVFRNDKLSESYRFERKDKAIEKMSQLKIKNRHDEHCKIVMEEVV